MPVVIPLLALGAAYAFARVRGVESQSEEPKPEPEPQEGPEVKVTIDWEPYLNDLKGDLDGQFLARWIAKESSGNPCAIGVWGGPWEAGIGQVYFDKDQRDATVFGATLNQLRECCYIGSEKMASPPTEVQIRVNAESLVNMARGYMNMAQGKIDALGEVWSPSDIQCLAKLYHALPVLATTHLSHASQTGQASDWNAYRSYMGGLDKQGLIAVDTEMGYPSGKGAAPYWPVDRLFDNAQFTGRGT